MKHISVFIIILLLIPLFISAENDTVSFVIAPPPIGYPVFEKGNKDTLVAGNIVYADYDFGDTDIKIFGPSFFGIYQYGITDRMAVNGRIGAAVLAGSEYSLLMLQIPLNISAAYEIIKTETNSFFLIAGAGGDIGRTSMKITIPQVVVLTLVEDETTLSTLTTTGNISGGAQANLGLGKFILSPFGTYTYTAGSYSTTQESSMSFDYPSASGSIPGFSTIIFGFDLLYKPKDISLSSQIHSTEDSTLVSLAMKWLLPGKKN